jgi:hypothetical protein
MSEGIQVKYDRDEVTFDFYIPVVLRCPWALAFEARCGLLLALGSGADAAGGLLTGAATRLCLAATAASCDMVPVLMSIVSRVSRCVKHISEQLRISRMTWKAVKTRPYKYTGLKYTPRISP